MELLAKMHQAAAEGDVAGVRKSIERNGQNVNSQGPMNRTALHQAAMAGKLEVVMYLVEKGANKDAQGNSGETPLHLAVINGHKAVVEYLLDEGANINIANGQGKKAVDLARKRDMREMLEQAAAGKLPKKLEDEREEEKRQKKEVFAPDAKVIDQLAALGYSKGTIFVAMHALYEAKQDCNNIGLCLKQLTKEKPAAGAAEEKKEAMVDADKRDEHLCKICFELPIDAVLLNCGHLCSCMDCAASLKQCPMCREPIARVVKTFKS